MSVTARIALAVSGKHLGVNDLGRPVFDFGLDEIVASSHPARLQGRRISSSPTTAPSPPRRMMTSTSTACWQARSAARST
jgi:hypothetical protein